MLGIHISSAAAQANESAEGPAHTDAALTRDPRQREAQHKAWVHAESWDHLRKAGIFPWRARCVPGKARRITPLPAATETSRRTRTLAPGVSAHQVSKLCQTRATGGGKCPSTSGKDLDCRLVSLAWPGLNQATRYSHAVKTTLRFQDCLQTRSQSGHWTLQRAFFTPSLS